MTASENIDDRVNILFQIVLAVPNGEVQQRALAAALNVADAKSRLHALVDAREVLYGQDLNYGALDQLIEQATEAVRVAASEAKGVRAKIRERSAGKNRGSA